MQEYTVHVKWVGGEEFETVSANSGLDAIAAVVKMMKAKERVRGYRPVESITVLTAGQYANLRIARGELTLADDGAPFAEDMGDDDNTAFRCKF